MRLMRRVDLGRIPVDRASPDCVYYATPDYFVPYRVNVPKSGFASRSLRGVPISNNRLFGYAVSNPNADCVGRRLDGPSSMTTSFPTR